MDETTGKTAWIGKVAGRTLPRQVMSIGPRRMAHGELPGCRPLVRVPQLAGLRPRHHLGDQVEHGAGQRPALAHDETAVAVPFARHADGPVAGERRQCIAQRAGAALPDLLRRAAGQTDSQALSRGA